MKSKKPKLLKSLIEFLNARGCSTPYEWAHALYRHTTCGPWVNFILRGNPEREVTETAIFLCRGKSLGLYNRSLLTPDFVGFLGFDRETGLSRKERTEKEYLQMLEKYESDPDKKYRVRHWVGSGYVRLLYVERVSIIPATTRSIYYGDLPRIPFELSGCIGIEIGSIVEGSDAEVQPRYLEFPFTEEQVDDAVKAIDDEAAFYWKRDNTDNYVLRDEGEKCGYVSWTAFDSKPRWSIAESTPASVKRAWVKWYKKDRWKNGWASISHDPVPFGPEGWTCQMWVDDSTY